MQLAIEIVDNIRLSRNVEITRDDQNVNGKPIDIEVNTGLAIPAPVLPPLSTNIPMSHAEKPKWFNGTDFKR